MAVVLLDTPKIMDIIGYIGGAILTLNLIPQIYKTWKTFSIKKYLKNIENFFYKKLIKKNIIRKLFL